MVLAEEEVFSLGDFPLGLARSGGVPPAATFGRGVLETVTLAPAISRFAFFSAFSCFSQVFSFFILWHGWGLIQPSSKRAVM